MAKKVPLLRVLWIVAILATSQTSSVASSETVEPASTASSTSAEASTPSTPAAPTSAQASTPSTPATPTSAQASTPSNPATATQPSSSATPPLSTSSEGQPTGATATTLPVPATTDVPNPCDSEPCRDGSTCESRVNQTYVCLCLPGETYNTNTRTCDTVKVFPGTLSLSIGYEDEMKDKTSQIFKDTSLIITNAIDAAFKTRTYSKSTVLELQPAGSRRGWLLRTTGINASVEIIFEANSEVTADEVRNQVTTSVTCETCSLPGSFDAADICGSNPCDSNSMSCTPQDGSFTCTCKDGFISTDFSDRICRVPCPQGGKYEDSECVPCQFGYSGFNCKESWKLSLIIVSSVLGALLLITIILLAVGACKSRKSSKKKKNEDFGKPYVSHSAAKAPLVNGSNNYAAPVNGLANSQVGSVGVPRIPRATATNSWDSRTNLEMTPSNSRQNLVPGGRNMRLNEDPDDIFPYAQSNNYAASRSQNSFYGQNRASVNPYAQSQGQSNPYYVPDDRGRFN